MRTERIGLTLAVVFGLGACALAQDDKKADAKAETKKAPAVAIVGADIYTVAGGVIKNGVVLIEDGKILKVGKDVEVPAEAKRIDAKGKCVTPGFVTVSASNVGIRAAGGGGPGGGGPPGQGGGGATGRVADTLNPFDRNILFSLASGITTACVETSGGGGGRFDVPAHGADHPAHTDRTHAAPPRRAANDLRRHDADARQGVAVLSPAVGLVRRGAQPASVA
jgi:hypothetical protein